MDIVVRSNPKINQRLAYGWQVEASVDDNGILHLCVTNQDTTDIFQVETGKVFGEQMQLMLSTDAIEETREEWAE